MQMHFQLETSRCCCLPWRGYAKHTNQAQQQQQQQQQQLLLLLHPPALREGLLGTAANLCPLEGQGIEREEQQQQQQLLLLLLLLILRRVLLQLHFVLQQPSLCLCYTYTSTACCSTAAAKTLSPY